MTETILFELRVTERGIEVTESETWRAYHAARAHGQPWPFRRRVHRWQLPFRRNLRQRLDTLQTIYDDLYGSPADR